MVAQLERNACGPRSASSPALCFAAGALAAATLFLLSTPAVLNWQQDGRGSQQGKSTRVRVHIESTVSTAAAPPPPPPSKRRLPGKPAAAAPAASTAKGPPARLGLPWKPLLRRQDVQRGLAYYGSGQRLQAVAAKLLAGAPIKAFTLGGSVTQGRGASKPELAFPSRFFRFLAEAFPHSGHVFANRGMGATSSGIFAACTERMVPLDADLVVLEFSLNDAADVAIDSPERRAYEQLLRNLLALPGRPALVQLHHFRWWLPPADGSSTGPLRGGLFHETAVEEQLTVFARYYDIPAVSVRSAVFPLIRAGLPGFKVDSVQGTNWGDTLGRRLPSAPPADWPALFYRDKSHPSDTGHQVLAELLAGVILRAAAAAAAADPDQAAAAAGMSAWQAGSRLDDGSGSKAQGGPGAAAGKAGQLPPPMLPGNDASQTRLCAIQEDFKGVVAASSGFDYKPEHPEAADFVAQKWAWKARRTGAWAEAVFDSRLAAAPPPADRGAAAGGNSSAAQQAAGGTPEGSNASSALASVALVYLRSYQGMGSARVSCVSGCKCSGSRIDGQWDNPAALQQMHRFKVSQHAECRIRVTVLPRDEGAEERGKDSDTTAAAAAAKRRGSRFSLMGLLVSHFPVRVPKDSESSVQAFVERHAGGGGQDRERQRGGAGEAG